MNINIKQLFNDLNITRDNFDWDIDDYYYLREKLGIETDLNAESLLDQAEQDFEAGGQGKFINSITNAKRAIQYRIDELIEHFGFDKNLGNQKKIEILTKIGFTTRILRKVSSARNLLEHEYKLPTE